MKTPRVKDFDPNAKEVPELKSSFDNMPVIHKPNQVSNELKNVLVPPGVPRTVPRPVPPSIPLVPKVKRPIRQRQPFDIFEDQYKKLKQIAASEQAFVNGRSMSQMVREAIDHYLRDHSSFKNN